MVLLNILLSFIVPPTLFFLGLIVLFNNPRSITNRIFFLLTIVMSGSSLGDFITKIITSSPEIFFWLKITMAFAALMPSLVILFIYTFPKDKFTLDKKIIAAEVLFSGIFLISALTGLLFQNAQYVNGDVVVYPGPVIPIFGLFFGLHAAIGAVHLFNRFKNDSGKEKEQIRYLSYGLVTTLLIIAITNLFFVIVLKNTQLVTLGPASFLIFEIMVFYAITRHRLLDIRVVVARTLAYSLLVATIAVFYVGSTILISDTLLRTSTNTTQLVVYSILTLIVAFTFQPLRRFFERITDRIFFKGDYDSNALLSSLTKIMAEKILIDDIAHSLLQRIIFEMRLTRGNFVLTDAGKIFVTESQGYKKTEEPRFSEKNIFALQALDKNLIFEEVEEGPAKELMRKLNVSVVIPLKTQVDHVGILLLGEKASGEIYSSKDISVLEIFAPEAAISFENAKSVEKIRRFNITLKEQVERATKQLRDANEQLKDLDKLKDEFLSIASHDLRTPMTAIKGYLWMALNDRAGKIDNPALKRYLDISYASAERMISLINDLLNVSRIKAGRMQMIFQEIDFEEIADQVIAELASKSTEKAIELKYKVEGQIPHLIADKQKIAEVLQNLVGNALKFTPEKGKITITAKKGKDAGMVEISVSDTGVGLSKEDAAKLFEKFGRVERSYTAAKTSGGTGLGLYITKNYVEMHGGQITVSSELGKGTTFTFTLKEFDKPTMDKMNIEATKNQPAASVPNPNNTITKEATVSAVSK